MKKEIERTLDITDKFILRQKTSEEVRELIYDYTRCNGCGICVYSCPVSAIELSEIHEIAKGLEMPPVMINHLECAFCGICYSLCPFDAYEFKINGRIVDKCELAISPVSMTIKEPECVECTLCYKVCPNEAIKREVFIRRQDIGEKNEDEDIIAEGKLEIDKEKCNLCGICAEFCDVFKMVGKEVTPNDPAPYEDILIDEKECDYCKLCEGMCPEEAIKVGGKKIEFVLPEKIAEISIDQSLCSYCGYCQNICPYEAIRTIKPIEGELKFYEGRAGKCDPLGCMACVNICKFNRVWYISEGLHFNEDYCIYCGACQNSCPYGIIDVKRICYYTKELRHAPWREAWNRALERVIKKKKVQKPETRLLGEVPVISKAEVRTDGVKCTDLGGLVILSETTYKRFQNILKNPGYRKAFERGNYEKIRKVVRKHVSEASERDSRDEKQKA